MSAGTGTRADTGVGNETGTGGCTDFGAGSCINFGACTGVCSITSFPISISPRLSKETQIQILRLSNFSHVFFCLSCESQEEIPL